jgi:predicted phosphodiesterase
MRIALISDIHGMYVALEAVLADIQRQHVDQIICLGDVATLGPQPCEVIARLKALDCPCVMGNHEAFLLDGDLIYTSTSVPMVIESVDWCARQLATTEVEYVRSLQPVITVSLDSTATLLCFHGSPKSNIDIMLATTPAAELDTLLAGATATVMAGGHTHIQMLRQHKGLLLVNPGSVGKPFAEMPYQGTPQLLPWAEYAIVHGRHGRVGVELRRVPMDLDALKQTILASTLPMREWLARQYA